EVPEPSQLTSMLRNAAVIEWAGVLTGTVLDRLGDVAVAGASVRIGPVRATTDQRGRFRLVRVPWTIPPVLSIEHSDFVGNTFTVRLRSPDVLDVRLFRVQRRPANQPAP